MLRKELIDMLLGNSMSITQIARSVGESPARVVDDLRHLLRSDVAQVYPGARTEQPQPQRLRRHFEAEPTDRQALRATATCSAMFMAKEVLPTLGPGAWHDAELKLGPSGFWDRPTPPSTVKQSGWHCSPKVVSSGQTCAGRAALNEHQFPFLTPALS